MPMTFHRLYPLSLLWHMEIGKEVRGGAFIWMGKELHFFLIKFDKSSVS